jgi:hypothetical protein
MTKAFLVVAVGSLLLGCAAKGPTRDPSAPDTETKEASQTTPGRKGSHGMVVAGTPSAAFLSHIPMFEQPHDVQLLMAGSFAPIGAASIPASFSEEPFTFLPDKFSLDELRLGKITEIAGTLFAGNFEQDGRPLPGRVRFTVARLLHQHILDSAQVQNGLTYFVFGTPAQTFAAHRIAGSPGFDEILRVRIEGPGAPPAQALAAGVEVQATNVSDAPTQRLGASTQAKSFKSGQGTFEMKNVTALSCLEGPEFSAPCGG